MSKESLFIKEITASKYIGDDGAFIDGYVYSKDAFLENVHFKTSWFTYEEIAYKASLVNISDAIAMNAIPKYALIAIGMPKAITPEQIKSLTKGFLRAAREYGYEIIGGDTVQNSKLDISITLISKTNSPLYRTGMKKGDLVAYTGNLGYVRKDLNKSLKGIKIAKTSKFIRPRLRGDFLYEVASYLHTALDISDGLSKELSRLSQLNSLGYKFKTSLKKELLCSGEEYELLFSFPPKHLNKIKHIAKKKRVKLTLIAQVKRGSYQSICKENHF